MHNNTSCHTADYRSFLTFSGQMEVEFCEHALLPCCMTWSVRRYNWRNNQGSSLLLVPNDKLDDAEAVLHCFTRSWSLRQVWTQSSKPPTRSGCISTRRCRCRMTCWRTAGAVWSHSCWSPRSMTTERRWAYMHACNLQTVLRWNDQCYAAGNHYTKQCGFFPFRLCGLCWRWLGCVWLSIAQTALCLALCSLSETSTRKWSSLKLF